MNNTLTNTSGIDSPIQVLQKDLYNNLITKWVDDIDGYGRVYRNKDNNSMSEIPQWWDSTKLDYVDVRYNDNVSGSFCFIDNARHTSEDSEVFVSEVKCVFMVNLNRILPNTTERADAQAQSDVINIIKRNPYDFQITGIEKGIDFIFSGFEREKIFNTDIQPKHCFCINIKVSYHINC